MNKLIKISIQNSNYNKVLTLILSSLILSSCVPSVSISLKKKAGKSIISGIVSPLAGFISYKSHSSFLMATADAAGCADPVYAQLYSIKNDGTIDINQPIETKLVGVDARYTFSNFNSTTSSNVQFIVRASGCNNDVYQRPVTSFDNAQDLNAVTTIVSEVLNAPTQKKLQEVEKEQVQTLITMMSGNTIGTALDSVTNNASISTKFNEIFGSSPEVLRNSKPQVTLNYPSLVVNELTVSNFNVSTYHIDPTYSFAYSWKLDGVVVSSAASWNYIPSENSSGNHQVDLYVGKDDLSGNIDLTKPFYTQTFTVDVNNNILPVAPAISINAATPSPRTVSSISIDINTGVGLVNCDTFSSLAITDSATPPGILQFNLDCTSAGTQTESVTFSAGEGTRAIYLWAMDNEGTISTPSTISFTKDSIAPVASVSVATSSLKGGGTQSVTLSATDATTGVSSLTLNFSETGSAPYTLVSNLSTLATTYSWTIPSVNTTAGKFQLVAVDGAGLTTTVYSNTISIDSLAPTAPALTLTSAANSNNSAVTMTVGSCTDISHILISTTNTQPLANAAGWVACSTTASAYSYTATVNGTNTLYAWAKDSVGNVATSANSVSMVFDNTNPVIVSGPVIAANVMGGTSYNITWSVTDAHTTLIDLDYYDGAVWNSIASGVANSGTHSWAIPANTNITSPKLRLKATDSFGNTSQIEKTNFRIDSIAPTISSFAMASGVLLVNTPTVSVQVAATDVAGGAGLYQMRLSEHVAYANDGWQSYSATNGSYSLSMTPGSKTVYIWVKDAAGNVSNSLSSTISLEFGAPPTLSITGPSITPMYLENDILSITWSCSSGSGLASNPIKDISYTVDNGANLVNITTNRLNNDTASTGHYDWTLPAVLSAMPFRVYVKCESASGAQVEKMSDIYQTNGTWRIWAGQMSAKRDGILAYGAAKMMITACSTSAIDSSGNIYYTSGTGTSNSDYITALMRINSVTGLIERVVGSYTASAVAAGEDLTSGLLSSHKIVQKDCSNVAAPVILGTSVDRTEVLFLDNANNTKIYGINSSNQARLYADLSYSILTKNFFRQNYFLTKNRILFYFYNNGLYRLDLSTPGKTATLIYGNGGAALNNIVGAEGTESPLKLAATGGTNNTTCVECMVIANADGTRLWVGGGYNASGSTGTNTWSELEYSTTTSTYHISSDTIDARRTLQNAHATDFDDKIYARGRDNSISLYIFDPQTAAATSSVSVNGFNGLGGGFYFNLFSSVSNLYMMDADQEIKIIEPDLSASSLVAGNNINKVGDGKGPGGVDFSNLTGITFDKSGGVLAISQTSNFRFYNFNDSASGFFSSSVSIRNTGAYVSKISLKKDGKNLLYHPSSGQATNLHLTTIDLNAKKELSTVLLTGAFDAIYSTIFDYDVNQGISNGTTISKLSRYFRNPISGAILSTTGAEYTAILAHSNGNHYIQAQSKTNNHSYIYALKTDGMIYKVAGKSGPAGYSVSDHGTAALGAQIGSKVSYFYEIKNGLYAGDILIVDGDMIRRLSITSESATPKIYDVAKFTIANDFSTSTVFSDISYDESSEIGGVSGTGTFYYVRTAPTLQIHKWKASDSNFIAAVDSTYTLTGLTLSGNYRLAHTPDGLLVLEQKLNRILRLPP